MPGRHAPLRLAAALLAVAALLAGALPPAGAALAAPAGQDSPPQRRGRVLLSAEGFLTGPAAGDALDLVRDYLARQRLALGLSPADLADIEVTDRYVSDVSGLTYLYLRQRLGGIPVHGATINASVTPDGRILSVGSSFVGDLALSAGAAAPRLTPVQAVEAAATGLGLKLTAPVTPLTAAAGADSAVRLSDGGISRSPIPASLAYVPVAPGDTRLSWRVVIDSVGREDWFEAFVDAASGAVIERVSYSPHADEGHPATHADAHASAHAGAGHGAGSLAARAAHGVLDGASYRVFPFPIDSPFDDGNPFNDERQLLVEPADPVASPFGWHDTDGRAGPEYTITRGNNVHAFQDRDANDQSAGDEPAGGPGLDFSPPLTLSASQDPVAFEAAATVNLFYANNAIHDVLFHNGFDEAAGNFQQTNYGGEGRGGDAVSAQSQDGAGFVNANFSAPPDGNPGRMQMYLGGQVSSTVLAFAPPLPSGAVTPGVASFGAQSFNLTAPLVLANDRGGASATDGCEALTNNVLGRIVLIDRGSCAFAVKAANAQAAGAVGVIIANNVASATAPAIGGSDPSITIGVLSVTLGVGNELKAALSQGPVSTVMSRSVSARTDGSLDNGVIAHEYAHGLSIRLTGGPATSSCLSNPEQAGEGWSDFLALVLTARPGDTATTPHAIGNYLLNTQGAPEGIRVYPYTTDLAANPQTYESIGDPALVAQLTTTYSVGTTWAAMLWEVYWNLVDDYGFEPDLIGGDGGNRLALQLVIEGMKLQPCNPTMIEARDAIVLADRAITGGANACRIWEGFARRGLGFGADAGDPDVIGDEVDDFSLPPGCTLNIEPERLEVCAPADAVFTVASGESLTDSSSLTVTSSPPGTTPSLGTANLAAGGQTTLTIAGTGGAAVGEHTVTVQGVVGSETYAPSATLHIANQAPAAPGIGAPVDGATGIALLPTFSWAAAAQAAGYRFELAERADFSQPLVDTRVDGTSYSYPLSLRAGRDYFWRVTGLNGCGNGAPSPGARFTAAAAPRILFVDDDANNPVDVAPRYALALNALNIPYAVWDTGDGTAEPPAGYLANFQTIIWAGGQGGSSDITPEGETALGQVLGNGRCLVVSAPDYFARRGVTDFMREYLGVVNAVDDPGQTTVSGAGFLSGRGPYSLAGNLAENFTDALFPNSTAAPILTGNAPVGGAVGVAKDGGSYRSAYFGMSLDGAGPAGLAQLIADLAAWCDIPRADLSVAREAGPATALLPGQPFTYTLRLRNLGANPAAGTTVRLTLPPEVTGAQVTASGLSLTPVPGEPLAYSLGTLAAGADGTLTVAGAVSATLSLAGVGAIRAEVATTTADAEGDNDSSQALLTFSVPQLRFAAESARADAGGRTATLRVLLSPVNPYAPATASYGLVSGATAGVDVGGGVVTVPAGASEAAITLTIDEAAALGGLKGVLVGLDSPAGAGLGTPAQSVLSYGLGELRLYLPLLRR